MQLVVARQYSIVKDRESFQQVAVNFQRSTLSKTAETRLLTADRYWWAWVESNYRPHPYQGCALTN